MASPEYQREYRKANLEKMRRYARDYAREQRKKFPEKFREAARKSAAKNPGVGSKFKRDLRRKFNLLKLDRPCYDCGGVFPPEVMDWDHLPGKTKSFSLNRLVSHGIPAIVDEIDKCQLVCANCHRIRTAARK